MKYRLAADASDYTLCAELMADEGFGETKIDFPTVMALDDDGELIGMLATMPRDDMVVAGPLVLRSGVRRPMLAVRLINLYEVTMRGLGISSVLFFTDHDSFLHKGVNRYFPQLKPYAEDEHGLFFVWPLNKELADGRRSEGPRA